MTSLLRVSDQDHDRILARIGAAAITCVALLSTAFMWNPFERKPTGVISVAIESPYVGQGVVAGTPVIMHGVKVGEVTGLTNLPGGGVRLLTTLQSKAIAGLTDAMDIDFRPANYFGVTGINLTATPDGQALRDGALIRVVPNGNFTLQTLLYRLGELSDQVIDQRLISVIDRATRYTDALNPLLETMIIVATTVTNVQTVSTERLLRNVTGINVALPGYFAALLTVGDRVFRSDIAMGASGNGFRPEDDMENNPYVSYYNDVEMRYYNNQLQLLATNPDAFVDGPLNEWLKGAETDLFSKVGTLEASHIYDLFPVVDQLRMMTDVVPKIVPAQDISNTLRELRTRLERMYAGSGEQRALQVRIILDQLPGVASEPLALALGAAQ